MSEREQARRLAEEARLAIECPPCFGGTDQENKLVRRWKETAKALEAALDREERLRRKLAREQARKRYYRDELADSGTRDDG